MSDKKFDVVVIGSGPGGYVAAIRCAQLGLKTACIEKESLGGTCLNIGCIPSKALLSASEFYMRMIHKASSYGISFEKPSFNFAKAMQRKREIVASFTQGVDFLFKKNNITSIKGYGVLKGPHLVEVEGSLIEATAIILATGSEPITLPFLPIDEKKVLTSTGALALETVPKKMIVIGAGIIGVELGSVYSRLGTEVVFVEFLSKICPTLDATIAESFQKILEKQGMQFHLNAKVVEAKIEEKGVFLKAEKSGSFIELQAEVALCSIGRRCFTKGLGLETLGIRVNEKGFIPVNARFQTTCPSVYAIGDVVDGPMLAHKASEEGVGVAEIIAGHKIVIDYILIPSVVYTDPEVAAVGLTEKEAKDHGFKVKTGSFPFKINSRAKCTGEEEGLVKIVADEGTGRVLGIHILGAHASELIGEGVVALAKKMTALELGTTFHAHPTLSEAIKEAALSVNDRAIHR